MGKPEAEVDAGALWLTFGENAAKADAKYKGKVLRVSADVQSVFADGDGYALGCLVYFNESPRNPPGVVARFGPKDKDTLAALHPGRPVSFVGRCVGAKAGGPRGYVVTMEGCRDLSAKR